MSNRRTGPHRDRHGRGMRGPAALPGPITPRGVPLARSDRERFDQLVLVAVHDLERRLGKELGRLEFAVEETPLLPDDWDMPTVPLASVVRGAGAKPSRVVLFRRPIELRAESREDLAALVFTVLVEQLAEYLGVPPQDIDPHWDD